MVSGMKFEFDERNGHHLSPTNREAHFILTSIADYPKFNSLLSDWI